MIQKYANPARFNRLASTLMPWFAWPAGLLLLGGLYFALFEEAKVSAAVTGTAVGLVSVVGFTPDIFVTFVAGVLIDRSPGLAGHQHFFLFLSAFAVIGLMASFALMRLAHPAEERTGDCTE